MLLLIDCEFDRIHSVVFALGFVIGIRLCQSGFLGICLVMGMPEIALAGFQNNP